MNTDEKTALINDLKQKYNSNLKMIEVLKEFIHLFDDLEKAKNNCLHYARNIKSNDAYIQCKNSTHTLKASINNFFNNHPNFKRIKKSDAFAKIRNLENENNEIINKLKSLSASSSKNTVDITNKHFEVSKSLPTKLYIGNFKSDSDFDINSINVQNELVCDLVKNGNIYIQSKDIQFSKQTLNVINALILNIYKSFPIGSVKIAIVDPENKFSSYFIYNNAFKGGILAARNLFDIYESYTKLFNEILDSEQDTILKSFVGNITDFYSLYESENDHAMTYVLCLSGFGKEYINGANQAKMINLISNSSNYHRCGFRCIVIDNFEDDQLNSSTGHNIKDCIPFFEYYINSNRNNYNCNNHYVDLIRIENNDLDLYVQKEVGQIAGKISQEGTRAISHREVGFNNGQFGRPDEKCLLVPIGLCNKKVYTLPLSCCSDDTEKGSIIGHMIIGHASSGKSSILKSFIINGSMKYSPDMLQFWLIDFKADSLAGQLENFGIPHIKKSAANSRMDDAYAIFQDLHSEITERNHMFVRVGSELGRNIENIAEYNEIALKYPDKYNIMPRICLCVDEMQEMFKSSNKYLTKTVDYLNSIVDKGRSTGVHMFLIAQKLSDNYQIKNGFLAQRVSQVIFNADEGMVATSGYNSDLFAPYKNQIANLPKGQCFISFGPNSFDLVKCSYDNHQELTKEVSEIRARYPSSSKILKIGNTNTLTGFDQSIILKENYFNALFDKNIINNKRSIDVVVGEDFSSLEPVKFVFSNKNSVGLIYGGDEQIATSILSSLLVSLASQGHDLHLIDGRHDDTLPFSYLYRNITLPNVHKYATYSVREFIGKLYYEYKKRSDLLEKEVQFDFKPTFVLIDDFMESETITASNNKISSDEFEPKEEAIIKDEPFKKKVEIKPIATGLTLDDFDEDATNPFMPDAPEEDEDDGFLKLMDSFGNDNVDTSMDDIERTYEDNQNETIKPKRNIPKANIYFDNIQIRAALLEIMEKGSKVNIHVVITDQNTDYDLSNLNKKAQNMIVFNDFVVSNTDNSTDLVEMLQSCKEVNRLTNTLAVYSTTSRYQKIRPIIYENEDDYNQLLKYLKNGGIY